MNATFSLEWYGEQRLILIDRLLAARTRVDFVMVALADGKSSAAELAVAVDCFRACEGTIRIFDGNVNYFFRPTDKQKEQR